MNFQANYPIYLQIAEDIKRRIVIGELKAGDKLPSNAELALAYQVNPNTVQRIYRQLEAEGISYTKRGIGTFLMENPEMPEQLRQEIGEKLSAQFLTATGERRHIMLKFEHVTKVYGGKKALNDLSISFQSGHVYALVGPNGSGKSTMMKAAAGLVKANTGSVTYQDMPIGVESKKHISYMSTEPFYYDYMKIRDVGQFYADFFEDFDGSRFASLLQFMQLTPDLKVKALSSGMAAKLKIAATLSRNAEVCMLDEPLNGIDLIGRDQIIQSILRAANPNATILISSHLFDELEPIVDHIVMMANGSLVLEGELEEIRTRYGKSISDLYREYFSGVSQPAFPQNPPVNPTV